MSTKSELDKFLKDTQIKSFKKTSYIVKNDDDALDIIQISMMKLVRSYQHKTIEEIKIIFPTILYNETMNFLNDNKKFKNNIISEEEIANPNNDDRQDLDSLLSSLSTDYREQKSPEEILQTQQIISYIDKTIRELPPRQAQAIYLRHVDGFSVEECAQIMSCSTGSVKTHTSRAIEYIINKLNSLQ